jgi:O-antigen ligase
VFLFLLVPILLAGERQAWLCYALVAVAFAWRESGAPLRFISWLAGAAIVVAVAMGAAWQWSPRFEARMARSVQAFDGSLAAVNFAGSGRLDIWRTAWRMFEAHPVNGVGVRDFRYAYPHFAPADDHFLTQENCGVGAGACHPHQLLLEIASETGVVGLALWFAGFVLALRAWRRAGSAARRAAFPATVAVATTLFPLNTHLAFYSAWWGLLFWWLLVVWCAALFAESGVHADPELAVHVSSRRPA